MYQKDGGNDGNTADLEAELASMTVQERSAMLQNWKEFNRRAVWNQSGEESGSQNLATNSIEAEPHPADHLEQCDNIKVVSFPVNDETNIEIIETIQGKRSDSFLTLQEPRPVSPDPADIPKSNPSPELRKPVSGTRRKILARLSKATEPYEAKLLEATAPARERISRATSPARERISRATSPAFETLEKVRAGPTMSKLNQHGELAAEKMLMTRDDVFDLAKVSCKRDYLCTQCNKFPFDSCVPSTNALVENGTATFRSSLRRIVLHRLGCRFCRLLVKVLSLPENDPLTHPQVSRYLESQLRYESMKTWIAKVDEKGIWYAYWHWPFGSNPENHPMGQDGYFDEGSTHFLGILTRAAGKVAVSAATKDFSLDSGMLLDRKNALPCYVEMEIKPCGDPFTSGLLYVKLLGYGNGPRAPMATLSSFRLRIASNYSHYVNQFPRPPLRFGQTVEKQKINVPLVTMWLHECENQHGIKCSKHGWSVVMRKPSFLRVIDVQENCIVEVANPEECRYAALSYVWGGVQHLQLQRYNKAELMEKNGLKVYDWAISKTILDAMTVVQQIGERYLWVDSMCILQDDDDSEKLKQINSMDQIYGSALFTIVAADATNADVGLEGVRRGSRSVVQLAEEVRPSFHIMAPLVTPQHLDKSPWNMRAWTMQERLLSRRLLIFSGGQVFWYCRERVMFEDMTADDKGEDYTPLKWLSLKPQYLGLNTRAGYVDGSIEVTREKITRIVRSGTFNEYSRLIEEYSQRQITYSHDVLNALAGLLHIFELCFKYPMRKGLPEILLDVAILWRPAEQIISRARRELPSWSWAGWIGRVAYEEPFSSFVSVDGQMKRVPQENGQERIRPLLRWHSWNARLGEFEPINGNGLGIPFGVNESETLPHELEKSPYGIPVPPLRASDLPQSTLDLLDDRHLIFWTICTSAFRFEDVHPHPDAVPHLLKAPIRRTIVDAGGTRRIGTLLLDSIGPERFDASAHEFIVLSEAQYYGVQNETAQRGEFMDYHLYNVMLVQWDERRRVASRLGLGRIEKSAWRRVEYALQVVILG